MEEIRADLDKVQARAENLNHERSSLAVLPELTDGQRQRIERLDAGIDKCQTEVDALREEMRTSLLDAHKRGLFEGSHGDDRGIPKPSTGPRRAPQARAGYEAVERAHSDGRLEDRAAERVVTLLDRDSTGLAARWSEAAGDRDYASAFAKLLNDPLNGHRSFTTGELDAFQRAEEVRVAINVGTGTQGGFMVPTHLDPAVILTNDSTINPLRAVSRVERLAVGNVWNGITSDGVVAGYAAELSEVTDQQPEFADPSIPVEKAHAFIGASIEATQDIAGLAQTIGAMFADAKDRVESEKFTTGTGQDNQPTGLLTKLMATTTSHVNVTTQGTFGPDDVYKLSEALAPRWRARSRYQADLTVLNLLEQFETGNGAKKFPEVAQGRLLRRPIDENSDLPTLASATNATNPLLIYGAFQQFIIVDKVGAQIEFIPHLFGTTNHLPIGRRGWYFYWRSGSDVIVPGAFRLLVDPDVS